MLILYVEFVIRKLEVYINVITVSVLCIQLFQNGGLEFIGTSYKTELRVVTSYFE